MKRTDRERMDRELARQVKRARNDERRISKSSDNSPGAFAKELAARLLSDGETIYNTEDEQVLELLMEMREELDDKALDAALRKAIKTTKVKDIKTPFDELRAQVD